VGSRVSAVGVKGRRRRVADVEIERGRVEAV